MQSVAKENLNSGGENSCFRSCRKKSQSWLQKTNLIIQRRKKAQRETFRSANNKRSRDGKYQEINEAVYQRYCLARDAMVPINGPMIREEATEIAKKLNKPAEYDGFKASSGWLECWKSCYGIKHRAVEGESSTN